MGVNLRFATKSNTSREADGFHLLIGGIDVGLGDSGPDGRVWKLHEAGRRQCDSVWDARARIMQTSEPIDAGKGGGQGDPAGPEKDQRENSAKKGRGQAVAERPLARQVP